jgi:hypothetical protein
VEGLISFLLDHEHDATAAAMWALEVSDTDLALTSRQRILLPTLGVRELALYMMGEEAGEGIPNRELFDKLRSARATLRSDANLDTELFGGLIDSAIASFAVACWRGWVAEHDNIVEAHNTILSQLSGMHRWQVNKAAVGQAVHPLLTALNEMDRYVYDVRSELTDQELQESLDNLRRSITELRPSLTSLSR